MREIEIVKTILSYFTNRLYECEIFEECLDKLIEELDGELKRESNNLCFVEAYDSEYIAIACYGRTIYVEIDYEVREILKVNKLEILKKG
jgi:hypothetical protein